MKNYTFTVFLISICSFCFSQTNTWTVSGNDIFNLNTGNVGIGSNSPQYKLDVFGDARVTNNLFVGAGIITTGTVNSNGEINGGNINVSSNLTVNGNLNFSSLGSGAKFKPLYVTPAGNVVSSLETEPGWLDPAQGFNACNPYSTPWKIGGNTITGSGYTDITAGTCDNFDFILKANGFNRQWIKVDGTIGFGTNIGSNTNGPEYRFNQGVIRLQGSNTYGGPQVVFDGGVSPFGDWGIEYLPSNNGVPGLNFWKPFASPNSANYLVFIGDDGRMTVGDQTEPSSSKFNVDGWGGDGIRSKVNNNTKAYSVFNKTSSLESFVVYANGRTQIGTTSPNPTGFLTITSANPNNAIEVRNSANGNNIGFLVQGDGSAIIKSTNSTSSFDVVDGSNNVNFRIKSTGFVYAREVRVMTGTFPDYVFAKNYKRISIPELDKFIVANQHLPGFEKAEYYIQNGLNTSEMFIKQQETIENLTLYIIDLEKRLSELEKR